MSFCIYMCIHILLVPFSVFVSLCVCVCIKVLRWIANANVIDSTFLSLLAIHLLYQNTMKSFNLVLHIYLHYSGEQKCCVSYACINTSSWHLLIYVF